MTDAARRAREYLKPFEGRCPRCGWPLAEDRTQGCVVGNCSYRSDDPAERERLRAGKQVQIPVQLLSELADENSRLAAENGRLRGKYHGLAESAVKLKNAVVEARAESARLAARVAEMEGALEPFASATCNADLIEPVECLRCAQLQPCSTVHPKPETCGVEDCIWCRARAALASEGKP